MMRPQAVFLDVDGTLIDSNDAHAQAWVDALSEFGYPVPFEQIRRRIGMGGDKLMPDVIGLEEDSDEGKAIARRRREIFTTRYLPTLRAFPGVRDLLRRMRDDGLTLVVATSAQEEELKGLLKVAGAGDLIEDRTSSSEVENSKPDPDIVQAALSKTGSPPQQVIMLGDTPYDVQAANRAGVRAIALRCGGWQDEYLRGAAAIYNDPADLLAHYEQSPLVQFDETG